MIPYREQNYSCFHPEETIEKDDNYYKSLHTAVQENKMEAALLHIRKGDLDGEHLNLLMLAAIENYNLVMIKMLIEHGMRDPQSIDMKTFNAAISLKNSDMIDYIIPHCQFLNPSDKYIPKELVIETGLQHRTSLEVLLKWNFTVNPIHCNNETFINAAIENGYSSIVMQLLKLGINVNMTNSKTGIPLLATACINRYHEIAEILLEHNANVDITVKIDRSKVNSQSCLLSKTDELKLPTFILLHKYNGRSLRCLEIAVINSDLSMTEILLRYGAKMTKDLQFIEIIKNAVRSNDVEIIRLFLNHGMNVKRSVGRSFLYSCVNDPFAEPDYSFNVAKLLLKKGADKHIKAPGNNFLFKAMENRHRKIAQLFLHYNADIQYINADCDTVLSKAIEDNYGIKFIKKVLKLNPLITLNNSWRLGACLKKYETSTRSQLKIFKTLLPCDEVINYTDDQWKTFWHFACAINNKDTSKITKLLLKHTTIEALKEGWTLLFMACNYRNNGMIQCLLDHGANIDYTNSKWSSSLHYAIHHKYSIAVYYLVKYGADIYIRDEKDRTPLEHAVEDMILSYEANLDDENFSLYEYTAMIKTLISQEMKLKISKLTVNDDSNSDITCFPDINVTLNHMEYSVNHILLLDVASRVEGRNNSEIEFSNDEDIQKEYGLEFKIRCEQEIEQMKMEKLDNHDVSFYDLLKQNIRFLGKFVKKNEIDQLLRQDVYNEKFPLYIDIVRNRCRNARIQYKWYKSNKTAKKYFWLNIDQRLPDHCVEMILNYLDVKDLQTFIKTYKDVDN